MNSPEQKEEFIDIEIPEDKGEDEVEVVEVNKEETEESPEAS